MGSPGIGMAAAGGEAGPGGEAALADLGRRLFFDPVLSASGKLACATCHDPRYAYGPPPGRAIALGGRDGAESGTRAVPALRYARGAPPFSPQHHFVDGDLGPMGGYTWDGRAGSIAEQAQLPLFAANEMANASPTDLVGRLRHSAHAAEFRDLFGAAVFDHPTRVLDSLLQALAAFQRLPAEFAPYTSRYDAYLRGEIELTDQEERGVEIFKDPQKGNCASCHTVTSQGGLPPTFSDYDYANVGVPRNPRIPANADPAYFDRGLCGPLRQDSAAKPEYCGLFRAPSLRNVAIRDAFFHNGVFGSLRRVLEFYAERDLFPEKYYSRNPDGSVHKFDDMPITQVDNVDRDAPLDRKPGAAPALAAADIDDLMAFLQTLTDADVARRAAAAPAALDWSRPWARPEPSPSLAAAHSDEYAWRLFVALNWPADPRARAADRKAMLGAAGPVVWETWQNSADVYREDGSDPGPWVAAASHAAWSSERRFESLSLPELRATRHIVGGVMVPLVDPLAKAKRLIEVRMSRESFDYVRSHGLYNVEGQLQAVARGRTVQFPFGSVQVKASWRPIAADQRSRYHSITVRFADGASRLYGLTALNIAAKELPNWFWASFEHVDNATRANAEGWQLPSHDEFACAGDSPDCNRPPRGVGVTGTVWENYRLRGTLTAFVDSARRPTRLANSELEAGVQLTASCITCHSRASIGVQSGLAVRLPVFDVAAARAEAAAEAAGAGTARAAIDATARRGYVGLPESDWFSGTPPFQPLDFVWSLAQAKPRQAQIAHDMGSNQVGELR
jgi:cytochrome c peroxidase